MMFKALCFGLAMTIAGVALAQEPQRLPTVEEYYQQEITARVALAGKLLGMLRQAQEENTKLKAELESLKPPEKK